MNPSLESVQNKIIAAMPEVLEVKFGCEGSDQYGNDWVHNGWDWYGKDKPMKNTGTPIVILGRPIRLADVLLAMGEGEWYIGQHGRFFRWSRAMGEMAGQPYFWDIAHDDLNQQSEECINFLDQIL